MNMIKCTINGKQIEAKEGSTILEAAKENSITIPSLCYLENIHKSGSCRICVVEVEGSKNLVASCITKVKEGMVIQTNSDRVRHARSVLYELILSDHDMECLFCKRSENCELQKLGKLLAIEESRFEGARSTRDTDASVSITRDASKCIICRRCVTACANIQEVGAINAQNRGFATTIGPAGDIPLGSSACTFCGQCTVVCPVGALKETDSTQELWKALNDPNKRTVIQCAPAVRVAIGECFDYPIGSRLTGKLAASMRELGFDDVFDTNWAADLTIMEEGTEFLGRVTKALTGKKATLPMITSCSPGWIKYIEHFYPDQLDHLSTCKSPHMMMGSVVKSYYADKIGVDPKDIFVASVMPCTAKKFEVKRPEMQINGNPNVDEVITTRELGEMIHSAGIDFKTLPESDFDRPLGLSSGAADIFGVTGGVMEAALRTVYELVTGRELPFENLHVTPIKGLEQIKECTVKIEDPLPAFDFLKDVEVKIAVTSGLSGAQKLMDQVEAGTSPYHFIEIMGCPGGCITGGGQPRSADPDVRAKRMNAIYDEDESKVLRKSHENPAIIEFYEKFLGEPNSHLAHELLHTHYTKRGEFNQLTDEDYAIDTPLPPEPMKHGERVAKMVANINREEEYPAKIRALQAQNEKLAKDLTSTERTVEKFRKMIAEYYKEK